MSRQDRMELIKKIQDKRGSALVSYITSDRLGLKREFLVTFFRCSTNICRT